MRRSVPQVTGSGQTEGEGSCKATPAERVRSELMDAVGEAGLNFSGYCRLAAQAMLQTAMEVEAAEFIGRVTYQRRGEDQSTYRNGYRRRKATTGEGPLELFVPQTRDGVEPFQTAILGAFPRRSELLDALIPAEVLERDMQGNVYSASRLLRSPSPRGIDAARGHGSRRTRGCAFRSRHRSPSVPGARWWAGRLTAEQMKNML
ncbi:MAG: transposase [Planctomycetota bacterium]